MRFIPLEHLSINTLLAPTETRARLVAALEAAPRGSTVPLAGTVGLATFVLRRVSPPPWALAPEFRGRIEPRGEGTRLTGIVSIGVPPVLVLAVGGVAAFLIGVDALRHLLLGEAADMLRLAPLATVVLVWVLTVRGVTAEARRLRRLLDPVLAPGSATEPLSSSSTWDDG